MSKYVLEIKLTEVTEPKPERPNPSDRYNKLPAEPERREVVAEATLAGSTLTEVGKKAASFLTAEGCIEARIQPFEAPTREDWPVGTVTS